MFQEIFRQEEEIGQSIGLFTQTSEIYGRHENDPCAVCDVRSIIPARRTCNSALIGSGEVDFLFRGFTADDALATASRLAEGEHARGSLGILLDLGFALT